MAASTKNRVSSKLLFIINALIFIFIFAPLVIVVIQSFTNENHMGFPPESYGVRWYAYVMTDDDWQNSFMNSLIVASIVAPLSMIVGGMAALGLDRSDFRGKQAVFSYLIAPMVLPHIVLGMALFRIGLFLDTSEGFALNATDSLWFYVVAHTTITIPYAIITIGASLQTLDRNLEEAAQILGASYFKTIFFITIPLIKSGLIGAFIFSFIISFDEFIVTYFLATFNQTLPIQIYSTLMFQLEPSIASISTLMLALTALLTLLLMSRGQLVSFGKIIK